MTDLLDITPLVADLPSRALYALLLFQPWEKSNQKLFFNLPHDLVSLHSEERLIPLPLHLASGTRTKHNLGQKKKTQNKNKKNMKLYVDS